ncbi:MAG: hypothetical protein WC919_04155 [Candidatus Paceibacterota bacterium]|jgi:hypothetical protein
MARRELWFAGMTREAIHIAIGARKARLLEMVRSGQPRPNRYSKDLDESSLARTLDAACDKGGDAYDFSFDIRVRAVPSDWFDPDRRERSAKAFQEALKLAKSGAPRPGWRSGKHGMAIDNQIGRHPEIFQPLRPEWFDPDRDERVIKLKEEILAYALAGGKRIHRKSAKNDEEMRFAEAIERFTSPSQHAYDAEFTAKLKLIRPDWFRDTKVEIVRHEDEKEKKMFLEMVASGVKRPSIKEQPKLARRLVRLIKKDEEFHRQIAMANPTWVGKSRDMKRFWIGLPDWLDKEYTHDGETLSIRKWATKLRCKENTLYQYLRDHTIEQAVKLHTRKNSLTCDGETMTLTQWANRLGITPPSLFGRLQSYPPEIALSPKNWENRKK